MLKGIDVSHYQGDIDFSKVKESGIDVVIIKATEGKTYQDPNFKTYYDNARDAGLLIGAYHFLRGNAAEDEVNNLLSVIEGLDFDSKVVIDAEVDLGGIEATSKQIKVFVDILKAKGMDVILYTGEYFYNNNLNDSIKDLPLWVAKYSSNKPNIPNFIGWQYSSSGSIDGINCKVDLDEFSEVILIEKASPQTKPNQIDNNTLELQKILNKLKIHDSKGNSLTEDGILGNCTKEAIKRIQSILGLTVDGIAGPQTLGAINSILAKPLLKIGVNCTATRYLQFRVGANYDGIFGWDTNRKVAIWQGQNGLSQDGIVGPNTWSKLIG